MHFDPKIYNYLKISVNNIQGDNTMVYLIGTMISFILYLLIGFIISKRIKGVEDFYVAGRNAPTLLIVGSLVASYLSTVAFMGEASLAYDGYVLPLIVQVAFAATGFSLGVIIFGKYLRRSRVLTLPEFFGKRFNSRKVRRAAAITMIVGLIPYLVAVTQGASIVLSELTGFGYGTSVIIITFTFTTVTYLSGAKGVLVTDTIMFLIFTVASFLCIPFILKATGGWPTAFIKTANLHEKPDLLSWHGITGEGAYLGTSLDVISFSIIIGLVLGLLAALSPWQTSRYLMAKTEHVAIRSGIIGTLFLVCFYLFVYPVITTINVVDSSIEPSEKVFIWAAMNMAPTWLGVLTICGILAAGLSSSSTFLQLIGYSVTRDLFKISGSNDRLLLVSRLAILGVGIVTLFITLWQPPAIYWIGVFAATLFAASWSPVAIASIHSKKVTKEGAFWSIITGFITVIVMEFLDYLGVVSLPMYLHSSVIGGFASLIAMVIGSTLTVPTQEEIEFRRNLLVQPESEYNEKEVKLTRKYPILLIFGGCFLIIFTFIIFYVPLYM